MRALVAKKLTESTPSRPKFALQAHITGGIRKLDQMDLELAVKGEPSDGFLWVVKAPDGRTDLYLDAGIAVASIQSWAKLRCRKFGLMKTSALPTLWISGLIKTGKSYTLREVVPAVLAETLRQQPPGHPLEGMAVLQLNGVALTRQAGATGVLYDMLLAVVDWATRAGVPVEEGTWRWVRQVLDSGPDAPGAQTRAGRAVVEMFTSGFQAPVLVLLDEVQALLQPTDARGDLDASGAAFIRDGVLRQVLVNSADHVLWAVTGSSMSAAWGALAAMPVNGTAPLMQTWPVHLPSAFPPALMHELANDMAQRHMREQGQDTHTGVDGDDMERLLEWSEGSPALFATMLEAWLARSSMPENALVDVGMFVSWFMQTKMLEEGLKEWKLGLAGLTDAQRGDVLDLASPTLGVQVDDLMDMGLWRFLQPHLLQTQQGARYYLKNASQRQLLRAIIDRGGKLRTNWTGISGGLTLIQLDWGWLLVQLGEVADYLLGLRPRRKGAVPERISGVDQFTVMLQSLAEKIGAQLPVVAAGESDNTTGSLASRWEALGAFSQALRSPANTAACHWYESEGRAKKKLQCNLDFLVFFLWLCRNVLAHQKPWDGPAVMVVVMALPRLLGMPAGELAEVVRCGMGGLAPATIKEAKAAADQDQDGDGGQGNSSGAGGGMSCY